MEIYESSAPLDEPYGHIRMVPFILSLLVVFGSIGVIIWLISILDTHNNETRSTNTARALVGTSFTPVRFLYDNRYPVLTYPVGWIENNCTLVNLRTAELVYVRSSWCDKSITVPNDVLDSLRLNRN